MEGMFLKSYENEIENMITVVVQSVFYLEIH
jgi:hypothetical protein